MARQQFKTMLVTGAKEKKKFTLNNVQKKLKEVVEETWTSEDKSLGYIITGTSRDIDNTVVAACKKLKLKCLQAPANFEMYSGASAEQIRNWDMFQTFKPDPVIIFSHKPIDETGDTVLEHLAKVVKKKQHLLKVFN